MATRIPSVAIMKKKDSIRSFCLIPFSMELFRGQPVHQNGDFSGWDNNMNPRSPRFPKTHLMHNVIQIILI